jgi:putative two-component system response regulator
MTNALSSRPTLLLVDDEPSNLQVLRLALQDEYRLLFAKNGETALMLASVESPDLVMLDIMMPGMSGYEVCQRLKESPATQHIPVIFITALSEESDEYLGFECGAVDYIMKPFRPAIVKARIRNHLRLVQADVLRKTRLQIVQCLGVAAEYKDNETSQHILRMSHYAQILALAAGYSATAAEELLHAAPMHDVGKIGIPDAILQKNGKLNEDEWFIMKQHTTIGADIIGQHDSSLLTLAASIAQNHHEKWDGSGYPNGLSGEAIPHAARIIAIVDVFDALTSVRPYKRAWSVEDAVNLIQSESGKHFDPALVTLFLQELPEMLKIKSQWLDDHPAWRDESIQVA